MSEFSLIFLLVNDLLLIRYSSLFIRYWLYISRIHKVKNSREERDENKVNNNHQHY